MHNFKVLDKSTVQEISKIKNEPEWVLEYRLKALETYKKLKMPIYGPSLKKLDLADIVYYKTPETLKKTSWEEIPKEIKEEFDRLGLPEAEKKYLAGVEVQVNSEAIYGNLKAGLEERGIIFTNIEEGLQKYPEIFKEYFGKLVEPSDNKFAALNSAVWSGGSFLYVPKNTRVELPLQAYFQIGRINLGQFERTLIIVEEGSYVHYIEGCTAPTYSKSMLHAGVVEVFVKPGASVRYTTIQNWSKNVYNLVTKKSRVEERGKMVWVDGNLGSKVTMKYPSCYLVGEGAHGEMLSIAYTREGQKISAGARMIHMAPQTTSKVISKSIAKHGGTATYRGELRIEKEAKNSRAFIKCDSLILDSKASANSYPKIEVLESSANVEHEASASRMEEEKLQYLQTRGFTEQGARDLLIKGFMEPVMKQIPVEYALEFNTLLEEEIK